MNKLYLLMASLPVMLGGCMPEWDMQGNNPQEYYKANPIKNKVESRSESQLVRFPAGANRLSGDQIDALFSSLAGISSVAVESVQVQVHPSQLNNTARREHLTKLLRSRGYAKQLFMFERSDSVARDEARIDVTYAKVVSPRCPDWRTSPVTTYSNASQGGYGCANVTNLGLMVADPRDLEKGQGMSRPDGERNWHVLQDYHANTSDDSKTGGADANATTDPTSSTK